MNAAVPHIAENDELQIVAVDTDVLPADLLDEHLSPGSDEGLSCDEDLWQPDFGPDFGPMPVELRHEIYYVWQKLVASTKKAYGYPNAMKGTTRNALWRQAQRQWNLVPERVADHDSAIRGIKAKLAQKLHKRLRASNGAGSAGSSRDGCGDVIEIQDDAEPPAIRRRIRKKSAQPANEPMCQ